MSEKLKTQQRDNELERLAHELEMKVLNQESTQQAEPEAPDNRCLHTVWSSHSVTFEGNKTRNEECCKLFSSPRSRFKMLESELESSLKKSLRIKDDKMAALETRLQESSTLNQQLRQELKTVSRKFHLCRPVCYQFVNLRKPSPLTPVTSQVKLSYEALQQRQEEERTASCSTPPRETGRTMSEWLRESQEATKELLKLKDRLIEVERNVSGLPL